VDGLTRVSVASAEKNYHDGNCEDHNLQEAAHLKRVVGVPFGRNSTDVLFEWPAKTLVLMGSDCFARDNHFRPENFHFKFTSRGAKRRPETRIVEDSVSDELAVNALEMRTSLKLRQQTRIRSPTSRGKSRTHLCLKFRRLHD
jgi:hypothetical protein